MHLIINVDIVLLCVCGAVGAEISRPNPYTYRWRGPGKKKKGERRSSKTNDTLAACGLLFD